MTNQNISQGLKPRALQVKNFRGIWYDKYFVSTVAEMPAKYQSDKKS